MAEAIQKTATIHAQEASPCSFVVWEGECCGTRIRVIVEEEEENSHLCGPAAFNEIYVEDGKILGVPDTEKFAKVRENGAATGISYLEAAANLAAARIEEAACSGEGTHVQVKMAKIPSDVNIKIENHVMRTITDNNKKIDVRGPVFISVQSVLDA